MLLAVGRAPAEQDGDDEGRHARADVDDGAAGEVERAELEQPAVDRPDPVGQRGVDEDRPQDREQDEGAEALALGEGARDERRGDGREHQLEGREQDERDGRRVDRRRLHADAVEHREVEAADQAPAVDVGAEGEGEADDDPHDRDEGQPEEAVHDRREHVLAADEAAVEERQARQHDHHEGCRHQQPGGISTVHPAILSSLRTPDTTAGVARSGLMRNAREPDGRVRPRGRTDKVSVGVRGLRADPESVASRVRRVVVRPAHQTGNRKARDGRSPGNGTTRWATPRPRRCHLGRSPMRMRTRTARLAIAAGLIVGLLAATPGIGHHPRPARRRRPPVRRPAVLLRPDAPRTRASAIRAAGSTAAARSSARPSS